MGMARRLPATDYSPINSAVTRGGGARQPTGITMLRRLFVDCMNGGQKIMKFSATEFNRRFYTAYTSERLLQSSVLWTVGHAESTNETGRVSPALGRPVRAPANIHLARDLLYGERPGSRNVRSMRRPHRSGRLPAPRPGSTRLVKNQSHTVIITRLTPFRCVITPDTRTGMECLWTKHANLYATVR